MSVMHTRSILASVAIAIGLGVPAAGAQEPQPAPGPSPPPEPQTERLPGIDAAYGVPPVDATVDPTTTAAPGYVDRAGEPPPDQSYGSTARSYGPDGQVVEGLQLYEEYLEPAETGYADEIPEHHVVQQGDTLWGISEYYLHDPYQWPKLWSWNEHVTNAHWIFPGDRILLRDPTKKRVIRDDDDDSKLRFSKTGIPEGARQETYMLNQIAYVEADEFETAMKIIGGAEAKVMMATLDTAYMSYDASNPPVPGERLVVYAPREKVYDFRSKKLLGYVVQIMGEMDVSSVARKAAEGVIANALNPVERGYRVGPLRRQFRRVREVEAEQSRTGRIVATLTSTGPVVLEREKKRKRKRKKDQHHVLVGEEQFVIIDLGKSSGLEVGNVLEVVRKGDEYTKKRVFKIPYEDGWPRRVIGALVVIQVEDETALAATIYSSREFERGDHVELGGGKKPTATASAGPDRGRIDAEGDARAKSGEGKVEGKASFEIGK